MTVILVLSCLGLACMGALLWALNIAYDKAHRDELLNSEHDTNPPEVWP